MRFLNFINEQKRFPWYDLLPRGSLDKIYYRLRIYVRRVDSFSEQIVPLKIDLYMGIRLEFICECIHKPGFSYLPCPHEDERLALGASVPVDNFLIDVSLHSIPSGAYCNTSRRYVPS